MSNPPRPLKDLVAPGQAQEIGLVVAIAAKIYAQRLVAEAVAIQEKEKQQQAQREEGVGPSSINTTQARNSTDSGALQCTAVWKAVQQRRRRGVDPGFFLQPAEDRFNWAAGVATTQHYDMRRLAAMAAEEEYDQQREKERLEEAKEDAMDINKSAESAKDGHQQVDEAVTRNAASSNDNGNDGTASDTGQLSRKNNDLADEEKSADKKTKDDPMDVDGAKKTLSDSKPAES